jgi:hypothetical protein
MTGLQSLGAYGSSASEFPPETESALAPNSAPTQKTTCTPATSSPQRRTNEKWPQRDLLNKLGRSCPKCNNAWKACSDAKGIWFITVSAPQWIVMKYSKEFSVPVETNAATHLL